MENSGEITADETRIYEIGYLLSPSVSTAALAETVEKNLKSLIINAGGSEVSDLPPRAIRLAYPIKRTVGHKLSTFREAFFGACRFRLAPAAVSAAGDALRASPELIRHLLIEVPSSARPEEKPPRAKTRRRPSLEEKFAGVEPVVPAMSREEMDKEIDQLLAAGSYSSK